MGIIAAIAIVAKLRRDEKRGFWLQNQNPPLQTLGKPLILETKVPAVWMTSKLLHHPIENLPKFTRFTLPSSC